MEIKRLPSWEIQVILPNKSENTRRKQDARRNKSEPMIETNDATTIYSASLVLLVPEEAKKNLGRRLGSASASPSARSLLRSAES